jgi:hypothetical protein
MNSVIVFAWRNPRKNSDTTDIDDHHTRLKTIPPPLPDFKSEALIFLSSRSISNYRFTKWTTGMYLWNSLRCGFLLLFAPRHLCPTDSGRTGNKTQTWSSKWGRPDFTYQTSGLVLTVHHSISSRFPQLNTISIILSPLTRTSNTYMTKWINGLSVQYTQMTTQFIPQSILSPCKI